MRFLAKPSGLAILGLLILERMYLQQMRCSMKRSMFTVLAFALFWGATSKTPVYAGALTGYYTQVANSDPDFGHNLATGVIPGLVQNQLGPNGLPVLSALGISYGLGNAVDINPTTHELLWWSPGADPNVSLDAHPVQTNSTPLNFPSNFYPTGQNNDFSFFRSVHWEGTFTMPSPGSITLSLGSDDDSWVFIDGTLKIDDGGTHGFSSVPNIISGLSAGTHTIDIFYDDREPVQAGIVFNSSITLNPTTAAPEPASLTLFGIGACVLMGYAGKRRKADQRMP